jgi:Cu/Ag efflux pump CusA
MRSIVGWSLRFRYIVIGLAAAALVFGVSQLSRAAVDVLPEFVPPYVEIQTEALGLSADEVEQLVTVPLEADLLHGVAFLNQIRSESVAGLSSIVLVFDPGTNVYRARQMVAERLTQAHALPSVSKPPAMLQPLSSQSRVLMIGLTSHDVSLINMSVLTRWNIRPRLLSVPGVANVTVFGQRERQLQVLVDPARLRTVGVTLEQVIETTGNAMWVSPLTFLDASTPGTGGFIDTPNQRMSIQHILPIEGPDQLAKVAVVPGAAGIQTLNGRPLQLGDVARVVEDHQPLIGDAIVNGGNGLVLVVEKAPGASTIEVTRGVEAALDALRPGLAGIDIDTSTFRPADYLSSATTNVALVGAIALLIVVIALGVLLSDWRAAVIALVTIPVSVIGAAFALILLGQSINALVVAGLVIAVAMLIDDVVVGFDSVVQRRRDPDSADTDRSTAGLILASTIESRTLIGYGLAILALSVVPLLFLGGVGGAFAPALAAAYLVAVAVSAVVALTLTPTLCLLLSARGLPTRRPVALAPRIRSRYAAALEAIARRTRVVAAVLAAGVIAATAILATTVVPRVADAPLPAFRESNVLITWNGPPGTAVAEMARVMNRAGAELKGTPGVRDVGGHVGRAVLADQIVGTDSGEMWLTLDANADYDRTVAAIENVIHGYPGLRRSTLTYPAARVADVVPVPNADLTVRVYGQDPNVLATTAGTVKDTISKIAGVSTASVERQVEEPTLNIQVDLAAAERYGIKPGDVRRSATTLLSGILAGSLFEDQKVFDVVVWGIPELRQSLDSIRGLMIDLPAGGQVRLGDVAHVDIGAGQSAIAREGVFRKLDVSVNVAGRDVNAVADDIHAALRGIAYPLEYRAEILGDFAARQAILARFAIACVVALLGAFLLLQAAFRSWRRALLVFIAVPAATSGGVLAALIAGPMSLGTVVGLLTVAGIAARGGILLVSRVQRLEAEGAPVSPTLVQRGATDRLSATLTTAITVALACIPAIVLGDRAGLEMLRSMSAVVAGGVLTAALVNAFVVPALYPAFASGYQPSASSEPLGDRPAFEPTSG